MLYIPLRDGSIKFGPCRIRITPNSLCIGWPMPYHSLVFWKTLILSHAELCIPKNFEPLPYHSLVFWKVFNMSHAVLKEICHLLCLRRLLFSIHILDFLLAGIIDPCRNCFLCGLLLFDVFKTKIIIICKPSIIYKIKSDF